VASDAFVGSIVIDATPDEVFRYFTEPEAIVAWMGDRASVDPQPGGRFLLHFDERVVEGRYIELVRPSRIVISWGRQGSKELPPHASTLTVTIERAGDGTRVSIVHTGLPPAERARHALGWQFYLARLETLSQRGIVAPHFVPEALTRGAD
jgi:uncharacterized protein YndB with AHSA1/START domain